jgi:hypothetical protein
MQDRNAMSEVDTNLIQLSFVVPELKGALSRGRGCCTLPDDVLIEEALRGAKQVRSVIVAYSGT